jgi:hypothetical protein
VLHEVVLDVLLARKGTLHLALQMAFLRRDAGARRRHRHAAVPAFLRDVSAAPRLDT